MLAREPLAWALAAFYFLTFGGFVAFSIYLPTLLRDQFGLKPADAGFRTAGFVVLATLCRPLGGWLSDRIGGSRVLSWILPAMAAFGLLLGVQSMLPFTVGALGCAALLGIGNGAVFQLVPRYFPTQRATVTGLVGAMGGMGGFFPPLLLGMFRDRLGVVWPGFLLLSAVACVLWWMNGRVFLPREEALAAKLPPALDPHRGSSPRRSLGHVVDLRSDRRHRAGLTQSAELRSCAGDLHLRDHFRDLGRRLPLLRLDTKASHRVYWQRGWQLFRNEESFEAFGQVVTLAGTHLLAQTFIAKRSRLRWAMHQMIFWGCMLAVADHVPAGIRMDSFHQRSRRSDDIRDVSVRVSRPARSICTRLRRCCFFTALIFRPFLVLGGIALSLWRRMRDEGARAVQTFAMDFWPLILLFAISITGLALTVSQEWLGGQLLRFHGDFARDHRDCRIALPSVREVLPHFPAARAVGREALPARRRGRRGCDLRPLRRAICIAHAC